MGWKKPSPGSGNFAPNKHDGDLVGFKPLRFEANVDTGFKVKVTVIDADGNEKEVEKPKMGDVVYADVEVFTGEHAGKTYTNAKVNAAHLVFQLKDDLNEAVLGRLSKTWGNGPNKGWEILPPTSADVEIANGSAEAPAVAAVCGDDEPPF